MTEKHTTKKIAFNSLGCKLSFTDNTNLSREIEEYGFEQVSFEDKADVYVINTCLVNGKAEKKFGELVRKVKFKNPDCKLVALGCYAEDRPDDVAAYDQVDLVLGNLHRYDIYQYLQDIDHYRNKTIISDSEIENLMHNDYHFEGVEQKRYVNVAGNCEYYCSYCSVDLNSRGNKPFNRKELLENLNTLAEKEVKEIVLSGLDQFSKTNDIIEFLNEIIQINGIERIRLTGLNPQLVTEELIDVVAKSRKLLPYFHLKVKSCCDAILKKMDEGFNKKSILSTVELINEKIPDARVGLDIFVGHPDETDLRYIKSFEFLRDLEIAFIHPFPFVSHNGFKNKIKPEELDRRMDLLVNLSKEKKFTFIRKNLNTARNVLFSNKKRDGYILGLTDNYIKVKTKYEPGLVNGVVNVQLTEFDSDGIMICRPLALAEA